MVLNEERECAVCFQAYSRSSRIPRILHCNHTFCTPCLDIMFRLQSGISTISCPMCRWITCTRVSLGMSGSLWVNTQIWDQLTEEQQHEDEEEFITNQTALQLAKETPASRHSGFKSKLLRKFFSCVHLQGHPGES